MKVLAFDVETNGLVKNRKASIKEESNWPRIVQIAWAIHEDGKETSTANYIVKPEGWEIPQQTTDIHGISQDHALKHGTPISEVLAHVNKDFKSVDLIIAHNMQFDAPILAAEQWRIGMDYNWMQKPRICTMLETIKYCAIPTRWGYKWPKLEELHQKLFNESFDGAHNALVDVNVTMKCYNELKKRNVLK